MLLLGACSVIEYAVKNARPLFSLGFKASHVEREIASIFYFVQREEKLNEIAMQIEELPNPPFTLPSTSESKLYFIVLKCKNAIALFSYLFTYANLKGACKSEGYCTNVCF